MGALHYFDPQVRYEELGFGDVNISRNTVAKMRDIIRQSSANEYVRKFAEHIVMDVRDRDRKGEVYAIFKWLQDHTRYANDPLGTEYIQTPPYVLKQIEAGLIPSLDCDDYVVTGLSLLRSLGYRTTIRAVGWGKNPNQKYSHVYGMVMISPQLGWVAFDCVRKDQTLGWQAPGIKAIMDLPV